MPYPHANETRLTHKPKIPPSLLKIPGRTQPASPPPFPGSGSGAGEGAGADPARLRILYRYFCFPSCLHILTEHNIYAFYIERINKYKSIAFRRRKNCKEGVRSWSPPGPNKGSVLHNLRHYRRPAG
ncbi:MAG: hypothetical protein ACK56F_04990 [bacterium]